MHFVLVHGLGHGSWCWYKLKPQLERLNHRVTAFDMAASGVDLRSIEDLKTFKNYTEPLLEFVASLHGEEKVILVGHSFGGLNLAFAMEAFPEKIQVAVFLSAFLPDTAHHPSYVLEQVPQGDVWMDTQFTVHAQGEDEEPFISSLVGPKFLTFLYSLCPIEDIELAKMLVRPGSFFVHDLSKANNFSNENFGSVKKVCIICKQDKVILESFQRWMIENNGGVDEVKELQDSDHMPMLSAPQELADCLVGIANDCAV